MRAFQPGSKSSPFPTSPSPLIFDPELLIRKFCPEFIFEGIGLTVNRVRKKVPERDHQHHPQQGTDKKSIRRYFLQEEQRGRKQGKYIHQYHHDPDLFAGDEMITQRLYHFAFVVGKKFRSHHPAKISAASQLQASPAILPPPSAGMPPISLSRRAALKKLTRRF